MTKSTMLMAMMMRQRGAMTIGQGNGEGLREGAHGNDDDDDQDDDDNGDD